MNWNCLSSVFSLEPFCQRQRGVVLHENISSQCRSPLIGQQQPQARKALCDEASTGLSPVKIWRKNTGLLQSSYTYRCSVERQFYRQQSISVGADGREGDRLFCTAQVVTVYSLHVQGKWALGMEGLQQPVPSLLFCIVMSLGRVICRSADNAGCDCKLPCSSLGLAE